MLSPWKVLICWLMSLTLVHSDPLPKGVRAILDDKERRPEVSQFIPLVLQELDKDPKLAARSWVACMEARLDPQLTPAEARFKRQPSEPVADLISASNRLLRAASRDEPLTAESWLQFRTALMEEEETYFTPVYQADLRESRIVAKDLRTRLNTTAQTKPKELIDYYGRQFKDVNQLLHERAVYLSAFAAIREAKLSGIQTREALDLLSDSEGFPPHLQKQVHFARAGICRQLNPWPNNDGPEFIEIWKHVLGDQSEAGRHTLFFLERHLRQSSRGPDQAPFRKLVFDFISRFDAFDSESTADRAIAYIMDDLLEMTPVDENQVLEETYGALYQRWAPIATDPDQEALGQWLVRLLVRLSARLESEEKVNSLVEYGAENMRGNLEVISALIENRHFAAAEMLLPIEGGLIDSYGKRYTRELRANLDDFLATLDRSDKTYIEGYFRSMANMWNPRWPDEEEGARVAKFAKRLDISNVRVIDQQTDLLGRLAFMPTARKELVEEFAAYAAKFDFEELLETKENGFEDTPTGERFERISRNQIQISEQLSREALALGQVEPMRNQVKVAEKLIRRAGGDHSAAEESLEFATNRLLHGMIDLVASDIPLGKSEELEKLVQWSYDYTMDRKASAFHKAGAILAIELFYARRDGQLSGLHSFLDENGGTRKQAYLKMKSEWPGWKLWFKAVGRFYLRPYRKEVRLNILKMMYSEPELVLGIVGDESTQGLLDGVKERTIATVDLVYLIESEDFNPPSRTLLKSEAALLMQDTRRRHVDYYPEEMARAEEFLEAALEEARLSEDPALKSSIFLGAAEFYLQENQKEEARNLFAEVKLEHLDTDQERERLERVKNGLE